MTNYAKITIKVHLTKSNMQACPILQLVSSQCNSKVSSLRDF